MDRIIELINTINPEAVELVQNRYRILREINFLQPIGRRTLSIKIGISERPLRKEILFLKEQRLINITKSGMVTTYEGKTLLDDLEKLVFHFKGLDYAAEVIKKKYNYNKVFIIPGDSDNEEMVKRSLGKQAAKILQENINLGDIIAITGGTTMAWIPEYINKNKLQNSIKVVPGRGALGENHEIQANTIVSKLSTKLDGSYKLLNIPDNLDEDAVETVKTIPEIKEAIEVIKRANILVYGIGRADEMAIRRNLSDEYIEMLKSCEAVAETLGYYFDRKGKIVYSTSSIGLSLSDLENIKMKIIVAGGSKKSDAISSFSKNNFNDILITDEGAAKGILKNIKREE